MESEVQQFGRIMYIEPNDAYTIDTFGGKRSITPSFEEYCIAFNLFIENYDRYRNDFSKATPTDIQDSDDDLSDKNYQVLSWVYTMKDKEKNISTLTGNTFGGIDGRSFLTTYYTDISHDNYGSHLQNRNSTRQIVEGLGVENIQVSFESWYTPTVSIKFVDVRGSALFGNEEAIHTGDNILTGSNLFSAFFTFPFPKFRLQLKGFLGKPVTYQLTVSSQAFNYNSQTGNCEMTVQFIGYSYSLLTDIPFEYIIAAPDCEYVGKKYWDGKVNSAEWQMADKNPPVKLSTLIENIRSAISKNPGSVNLTQEETDEISNQTVTSILFDRLKAFYSKLSGMQGYVLHTRIQKSYQVVFWSENQEIKVSDEIKTAFNDLKQALITFNETYPENKIDETMLPNKWSELPDTFKFTHLVKIEKNRKTIISANIIALEEGQEVNLTNIQKIKLNDEQTLNEYHAQNILQAIETPSTYSFSEYAFIFDFSIWEKIKELKDKIDVDVNNIINKTRKSLSQRQKEAEVFQMIGVVPYIGNIFKIIMCHLETFVHIMMCAGEDIYNSRRTLGDLNLILENTDLKSAEDSVPPWPLVLSENAEATEEELSATFNSIGWVGDYSPNFEEEEVITNLMAAIKRRIEAKQNADLNAKKYGNFIALPLAACDFTSFTSPYKNLSECSDIGSIAGYTAMRATQISMMDSVDNADRAELFGRLDAYNLYLGGSGATSIQKEIFDKVGSEDIVTIFENISRCLPEGDKYGNTYEGTDAVSHRFEIVKETVYGSSHRHTMLKEQEKYLYYVYLYTKNKFSIVPSVLKPFDKYKEIFNYEPGNNPSTDSYFTLKDTNSNERNWIYFNSSKNMMKDLGINDDNYVNKSMLNIVTPDDSEYGAIETLYGKLKEGKMEVKGTSVSEDLSPILNRYWQVEYKDYKKYFGRGTLFTARNVVWFNNNETNKEEKLLPMKDGDNIPSPLFTGLGECDSFSNTCEMDDEGTFTLGSKTKIPLKDACIRYFDISIDSNYYCLFGTPFYYMQNKINDIETRKKVKVLLFLHTLHYKYKDVTFNVVSKNKQHGGIEAVPRGYILLLGGLLWRKSCNNDPIIFSEGSVIYKSVDKSKSLLVNTTDNDTSYTSYMFSIFTNGNHSSISLLTLLGGDDIDINLKNQLITKFEESYSEIYDNIIKLELHNGTDDHTGTTMQKLIADMYEQQHGNLDSSKKLSMSEWYTKLLDKSDWLGKYRIIGCGKGKNKGFEMLIEDEFEVQTFFKELYATKIYVIDATFKRSIDNLSTFKGINFSKEKFYIPFIKGFTTRLNELTQSASTSVMHNNIVNGTSNELDQDKDLLISMYTYLKKLWDCWLVTSKVDEFTVNNFFNPNFFFIDSYYRNTRNKLAINCETLLKCIDTDGPDISVFTVMNDIISEHHCLFFALPDYLGFNSTDADIDTLTTMFKPMPYNKMPAPSRCNKFVIIYTFKPSEISDETNDFKRDGFNIGDEDVQKLFEAVPINTSGQNNEDINRYGYNIPSFGVAVNRQNNTIFKNINVNSNNPTVTDQSIKIYANILQQGAAPGRKIAFHGQDIYSIYSAYSYECEVEMIGNAQICPLMYFQLLNVPLWRGTYMIFNVTHQMTAGDMVTRFKGMKMSKTCTNFATNFWGKADTGDLPGSGGNVGCGDDNNASNNENYANGTVYTTSGSDGSIYPNDRPIDAQLRSAGAGKVSPWDNLFKKYGSQYGFDWRFLASFCWTECGYKTGLTSSAGALGIMQIMPGTAKGYNFTKDDVMNDHDKAIQCACMVLRDNKKTLTKYFKDETELIKATVASYNCGAGSKSKRSGVIGACIKAAEKGYKSDIYYQNVERCVPAETGKYVPITLGNYEKIKQHVPE